MKPLQKFVGYVFGVLCLLIGAGLLLAPGRFLGVVYWEPVDPHLSRIMGAALLAISWLVWRVLHTDENQLISIGAEVFFLFTFLSCIGLLRHLLVANYPLMMWFLATILLLFALYWGILWIRVKPKKEDSETKNSTAL